MVEFEQLVRGMGGLEGGKVKAETAIGVLGRLLGGVNLQQRFQESFCSEGNQAGFCQK